MPQGIGGKRSVANSLLSLHCDACAPVMANLCALPATKAFKVTRLWPLSGTSAHLGGRRGVPHRVNQ